MTRAFLVAALVGVIGCAGCRVEDQPDPSTASLPSVDAPSAPDTGAADSTAASDSVIVGDPPTAVPGPLREPPAEWTTRTTTTVRSHGVATLTSLRVASHDGFDRVVFELDSTIPGYHVEYVDRPAYACGSGDAVYLAGDAWLLVRLQPAMAHDDAGVPTIATRRQAFTLPVLREAALTCDFEADVSWILGLASPGGYRITELRNPPRLVIELRH